MSVGSAHDLTGRKEATPEEFKYRPSAGEKSIRDENATIKSIKGNSVVWNNKIKNGNFADNQASDALPNGWENGSYYITLRATISYPSTGGINFLFDKGNSTTNNITMNNIGFDGIIKGHKYLLSCDYSVNGVSETSYPNQLLALGGTEGSAVRKYLPNTNGVKTHFETIHQPTDSSNKFAIQMVYGYVEGAELWINNIIYIDLTQMFGSGNEPATVDEFYARIPEGVDINAYNEGELINFTAESIKTTGFNQFNGVVMDGYINDANGEHVATTQYKCTDYISVLSNQEYYINSEQTGGFWGAWYDSDKKFIKGIAFYGSEPLATSPTNAAYIRMTIATPSNLGNPDTYCINLSHSGVRDGEYEPYKEFTHDLSWIKKYFPNGMKSAGSVYDEITETEAIQRIGEVDLGSLNWESETSSLNYTFWYAKLTGVKRAAGYGEKANAICSALDIARAYPIGDVELSMDSLMVYYDSMEYIYVRTSHTDVESFKEAMSGVKLYYELVEPIVTPIEEVVNFSYEVGDFGTEEIISNGPTTPFKGNIVYGFNAVDRIRDNSRNIEKLNEKTSNKVDKENGKGLSSNDYTSEEKEQVERVRNGSVVVDNTLSALDETSNKPVDSKAVVPIVKGVEQNNENIKAISLSLGNPLLREVSGWSKGYITASVGDTTSFNVALDPAFCHIKVSVKAGESYNVDIESRDWGGPKFLITNTEGQVTEAVVMRNSPQTIQVNIVEDGYLVVNAAQAYKHHLCKLVTFDERIRVLETSIAKELHGIQEDIINVSTTTEGWEYSHKIDVSIPAGASVCISIRSNGGIFKDDLIGSVSVQYTDSIVGVSESVSSISSDIRFVAEDDISHIKLTRSMTGVIGSGEVTVIVSYESDGLMDEIELLKRDMNKTLNKVDKVEGKQDALTLTVKDNGNIVLGNIAGQTKEFMPATPSGDPMHYYYLSHFGVTYNENTGFFELEYLKDLTANDMRNAVRVSGDFRWLYNEASSVSALVATEDRPRTNIAMKSGNMKVSDKYDIPRWCRALEQWIIGKCSASSFATLTDIYDGNAGVKVALVGLAELRYIVGVIDISTLREGILSSLLGDSTTKLQEVRLAKMKTSQTIITQTKLSKDSISYLLSNRINTEEISLSLPAELYNKIMTDGGEWADLRSLCEATTDKGKVILELNA